MKGRTADDARIEEPIMIDRSLIFVLFVIFVVQKHLATKSSARPSAATQKKTTTNQTNYTNKKRTADVADTRG